MKRSVAVSAACAALVATIGLGVFLLRTGDTGTKSPPAPPGPLVRVTKPVATGSRTVATLATPTRAAVKLVPPRERGPEKPDTLDVKGTVTNIEGKPIAGARVRLASEKGETTTGADGAFSIFPWGVEPGRKLALFVSGPAPYSSRVVGGIVPGTSGLVVVLRDGEASVRGKVLRAKDGSPVASARVEGTYGDWVARAETDASGSWSFAAAPAGALALVVTAPGCVPRTLGVTTMRGQVVERDVLIDTGVTIAGKVVRDGKPAPRASVLVRLEGVPVAFEKRTTQADEQGAFSFDAIPACAARLRARTGDAVSAVHEVFSDGASTPDPVVLELGAGAWLTGRVSSGGAPVAGAALTLIDEDDEKISSASASDGRFKLGPLPKEGAGIRDVKCEAKGFAPARVRAPATGELAIELAKGASFTVSVSPPEGAQAEVEAADGERRFLKESARSGARVELRADDLPAGRAWVVVRAPGRAPHSRALDVAAPGTRIDVDLAAGQSIEGRVVGDDGQPVAGASVLALDAQAGPLGAARTGTAGLDGSFVVADVAAGPVQLVASAPGYLDGQLATSGGAKSVVLELPRSCPLEVRVTVPDEKPEEHAHEGHEHGHEQRGRVLVRVSGPGLAMPERRIVNAEEGVATALFESLRSGLHRVEVLSPGFAPATIDVDPRVRSTVEVALAEGARASGVVLGADGQPLAGASITRGSALDERRTLDEDLHDEGSFATLLAMTEGDGTFSIAIAPGGEDVLVSHPDHAPLAGRLGPGSGQKLTLAAGARLSGRTLDRDGRPQPGVGVALEGPVTRRGASNEEGVFLFSGLPPGRYRVKRHDAPPEDPGDDVSLGKRGEASIDLKAR